MPLLDAVRLLSQPEADAASPSGTPARLPEGESKADLGRSHYRTPTNAADLVYQNAAALVPTNPWLRDKLKVLTQHASPPPHATETEAPTPAKPPDLVTLDQAAGIVHKSKRAPEYYKTRGEFPEPVKEGGGGKSALYDWKVIRPWLVKEFGFPLPEKFPRIRET